MEQIGQEKYEALVHGVCNVLQGELAIDALKVLAACVGIVMGGAPHPKKEERDSVLRQFLDFAKQSEDFTRKQSEDFTRKQMQELMAKHAQA